MGREKQTPEDFQMYWQSAESLAAAANVMGMTPRSASQRASNLRRRGVHLKTFTASSVDHLGELSPEAARKKLQAHLGIKIKDPDEYDGPRPGLRKSGPKVDSNAIRETAIRSKNDERIAKGLGPTPLGPGQEPEPGHPAYIPKGEDLVNGVVYVDEGDDGEADGLGPW